MSALATRRPDAASRRKRQRDALWVDVPFTKAPVATDGSGDIVLSGYASTWGMDRDDELVAPNAFDKSLQDYLAKNPIVLWQHSMDWPIGQITSASTDQTGLYVTARIPNPGTDAADWQKGAYSAIRNGIVKTFSIGGYFTRDVKQGPDGPVFYITEVDLFEVSCVSIPANADSIYEAAVKAISGERPAMREKAREQMEQLMGVRVLADPELLAMTPEERQKRWEDLSALYERAYEMPAPPRDTFLQVMKAREAGVEPASVQKALSELQRALADPAGVAAEQKAGRAISQANRDKLQEALDNHDGIEGDMVAAADHMKAAAQKHSDAVAAIKSVLGIEDAASQDPDEDEYEDEGPEAGAEKAAEPGAKEWSGDIFARLRELGTDRFGTDDPDANTYVYVDDYDPDRGVVVYCVYYGGGDEDYFQVQFTRADDGTILLAPSQQEVVPTHGYVPKSAASPRAKTGREVRALPTCPECGTTISDPSEGCPNEDCDYTVPEKAASDAEEKAYVPAPYEREGDETVACPACGRFGDSDARYCDQCGTQLEGRTDVGGADGSQDGGAYEPEPYSADSDENVVCPQCERQNDEDASYCDQCGFQLEGAEGVLRTSARPTSRKGALSAPSAPFADRDTAWSAAAAVKRVRNWAGVGESTDSPNAKVKQAYLWQDGDGSNWTDLKYPVCDVVGGELKCVFRAVSAAAARAKQQNLDAIKPALTTLYKRAAKQFGDDSLTPPWQED